MAQRRNTRIRCDGCNESMGIDHPSLRVRRSNHNDLEMLKGHIECIEQTFIAEDFAPQEQPS